MTYTFKLSRRLAVSRRLALLSGVIAVSACAGDTPVAPEDFPSTFPTSVPLDQGDSALSGTTASTTLRQIVLAPANVTIKTYRTVQYRWFGHTTTWDSVAVTVALTATGGTITPAGLYTAGKNAGTYRVIALSGSLADTSIVVLTAALPPITRVPAPTPVPAPAPAPPPAPVPTTPIGPVGAGVPVGPFHLPNDQFGVRTWYNGTLRALSTSSASSDLAAAKAKGVRMVVSLPGGRGGYTNSNGTFSLSLWKQKMDQWRSSAALLNGYYASGTIMANYLVDEPDCSSCWGGRPIAYADIDEMGRYAKSLFPAVPTVVRVVPSYFRRGVYTFRYIDLAWAQYEGPLHQPSLRMTPEQFRAQVVADAKALGMGLIMGLNTLDGGDGSSRINGTFDLRTVSTRWQMSAAEVERAGMVFAQEPYACGVLNWRYSPTATASRYTIAQANGIQAFDNRSDVKAAFVKVLTAAKSRVATRCS